MASAQGRAFSGTSVWDLNPTDVLDAADGPDPYDFDLVVLFDQSFESGTIQREYHCSNDRLLRVSGTAATGATYARESDAAYGERLRTGQDPNCPPNEGRIVPAREMDYERTRRRINLLGRFGVWKDIELHVFVPIVLHDQISLEMASHGERANARELLSYCAGGDCSQSSVFRTTATGEPDYLNSFFVLPNKSVIRAAIDNPTIGAWWAPFNHERDDTQATWRIGIDYTLNVVDRMLPGVAERVGQGYDELRLSTAMSRRFSVMDPFVEFSYSFSNVIETSSSPFESLGGGQTLDEPGDRLGLRFGSSVVPWEDKEQDQWFGLDFGGEFIYQFEGRDYTPLFTALGSSDCNTYVETDAQGNVTDRCRLTMLKGFYPNGQPRYTEGITDVEQFGVLRGWFGMTLQAFRLVRFQARAVLAHQMNHFLTFADAGRDNGEQGVIDGVSYNKGTIDPGTSEENPLFGQDMDLAGTRFRLSSHLDFGFFFTGMMTF